MNNNNNYNTNNQCGNQPNKFNENFNFTPPFNTSIIVNNNITNINFTNYINKEDTYVQNNLEHVNFTRNSFRKNSLKNINVKNINNCSPPINHINSEEGHQKLTFSNNNSLKNSYNKFNTPNSIFKY